MLRLVGSFGAGLVAGVALCVAPAVFILVSLSSASGPASWLFLAWYSFAHPWRYVLAW